MSEYEVAVTVEYRLTIDTDWGGDYPPDVTAKKKGRALAEAMARFDAEASSEPLDVYARDQRVVAVGPWTEVSS